MSKIAVVTDSISCLPADLAKKYDIIIAPCYLIWDKMQYRDGVDITAKEVYERLRTSRTVPTTSSSIQGEYLQIYESLKGKVDGVVTITVTGGLGASYNSALIAKEMVPGFPIEIIDSRTAHLAQGFMALAAAKVAKGGGSMQETSPGSKGNHDKVT